MGKRFNTTNRSKPSAHSNPVVAIDIVTTNDDPDTGELTHVFCVPLSTGFGPSMDFTPTEVTIKPTLDNVKGRHYDLTLINNAKKYGLDEFTAHDAFVAWLPETKIIPLGWRYSNSERWLRDWLGSDYDDHFLSDYRDLYMIGCFMLDRESVKGIDTTQYQSEYSQFSFLMLCNKYGIKLDKYHLTAYDRVRNTGELYRRILLDKLI